MPKTLAELRQELQDAGRDVRMAGEMVERASGGSQDISLMTDAFIAAHEALGQWYLTFREFDVTRQFEAAK